MNSRKNMTLFHFGDRVIWKDPETNEETFGWRILSIPERDDDDMFPEDGIYTIVNDNGSEAEVYEAELRIDSDALPADDFIDNMVGDFETGDFEVYDSFKYNEELVGLYVVLGIETNSSEEVSEVLGNAAASWGWYVHGLRRTDTFTIGSPTQSIEVRFRKRQKGE